MKALERILCCVFLLLLLVTVVMVVGSITAAAAGVGREYSRADFPPAPGFVFGSATSAYQVEGAAAEDGRSPSIWDTAAHAGRTVDRATGDITCDGYHKYKDDVKLMKETGLEAYRFSISWSRLLPKGRGVINQKGFKYYNSLIDELISHGIQPHVTLFHYDLPQVLADEYNGWLSPKIVSDFAAYADVCFREFGDRVSHWTTLNEPNVFAIGGYDRGLTPPFRCSTPFASNCTAGDSTLEPYIVAHHCLLAHAAAASLYKTKYQAKQQGLIGLNIFVYHFIPLTSSQEDIAATQRAVDFYTGWFMEPLVYGDYPRTMKERTGSKMPSFGEHQRKQMLGSYDFVGINHYATLGVSEDGPSNNATTYHRDFNADLSVKLTVSTSSVDDSVEVSFTYASSQGPVLNEEVATFIFFEQKCHKSKFLTWCKRGLYMQFPIPISPYGLRGALEYFKHAYRNPPVYIHENGCMTPHSSLDDVVRIKYLEAFIGSLLDAVRNGSNARGYFTWSFLDVLELLEGYKGSYGLYYVDFEGKDLQRRPKLSARWYSHFLRNVKLQLFADAGVNVIETGELPPYQNASTS